MNEIRFRFHPEKAFAFIHLMVSEGEIDLHTALKACYFADKKHLNKYYKPIFGATYKAMRYGPVPLEIYDMMKGEPYYLAEISKLKYPWQLNAYTLKLFENNGNLNLEELSIENRKYLKNALKLSKSLTFNQRTAQTHQTDWQRANLGIMLYEDMLDETDDKHLIIEDLKQTAHLMRL